jgi:hypothetical protein
VSCCQSLWRARGLTLLPIATPGRESGRRGRSELAESWRDVSRRLARRRRGTSGASSVDRKINNQRPDPVRLAKPTRTVCDVVRSVPRAKSAHEIDDEAD